MYGFLVRPRWIAFHLLVVAVIVLMVSLGLWQLRRLDERQAFNDRVSERIDEPPAAIDELVPADADADKATLDDIEWRPVTAEGRYLPDEQVVVVNRSQGGQAGDMVITPLQLGDGRILLVERGFVPLDGAIGPSPSGDVTIVGRLRESQVRRRGQLTDPAEGDLTELQRLDITRVAAQLPGSVLPMYVELTASDPPATDDSPVPVIEPELTSGPHLSYAVQWFIFSVLAVVGWVLAVRKSASTSTTPREPVGDVKVGVDAGH